MDPIATTLGNITRQARLGSGADKALAALVGIAELDANLCTQEIPRGSNSGPQIAKFFAADNYDPEGGKDTGYAWCAAAVDYWVQTWLARCEEAKRLFGKVQPPRTAAAFGLQTWGEAQKGAVLVIKGALLRSRTERVYPGDIIIFEFSHCGIAKTASKDGFFTCIEGNTDSQGSREGWQVARRIRGLSSVRALVRFVPKGVPV